jgi:RNA polymerase sigma factor (sigma-70 family)
MESSACFGAVFSDSWETADGPCCSDANADPPGSRRNYADAVRAFLALQGDLIHRLASEIVRRGDMRLQAHDVAQDVIAALLLQSRKGRFRPERVEHPAAYLRAVVRRAARRALVRAARESLADAPDEAKVDSERFPTPEAAALRAESVGRILRALKSALHPRDATVCELLLEEGLDIGEVADLLGCTRNNVYQIRHRILAAARRVLPEDRGESPTRAARISKSACRSASGGVR